MKRTLDVVVPCYNEADCVDLLYKELEKVLDPIEYLDWTLILVDDGSRDSTMFHIKNLAKEHGNERVKYISFSRNFGKESAIYAGLSYASSDYVVLMDADLQHPPALLKDMLNALVNEDYDVCGARRVSREGEPLIRSGLSNLFYKLFNKVTAIELIPGGSDFRMMKNSVVKAMLDMQERGRFTKGMMSWVGFKTKWIEYKNVQRAAGATKWSARGLMHYAIDGFFAFATTPLRAVIWLGFLIDFVTFISAIIFAVRELSNNGPRTGYGTIVILIAFFGGTILLILGIIGEYLARIYLEVKRRPIFIARETNIKSK